MALGAVLASCWAPESLSELQAAEVAIGSSTVTYATRPVDLLEIAALRLVGFFSTAEDYRSYFGTLAAGVAGFCDDRVVDVWSGVSSHATCGGPAGSFASRTRVVFTVPTDSAEAWQIQIRPDYGLGGAVFLDDVPVAFNRDDMWEGVGQVFTLALPIAAGRHVLDAYGIENCCDGATFGLYVPPGGSLQAFATVQPLNICQRIDQAFGGGRWKVAGTAWRFSSEGTPGLGCRARDAAGYFDGNQPSAAQDQLLTSVMLQPSQPSLESSSACAVLEQSLELCRSGTSTPPLIVNLDGAGNVLPSDQTTTRTASCHPGAEVNCESRHQPVFATILSKASRSFDGAVDTPPETYCSGQVAGTTGYARSRATTHPDWTCTDEDLPRLNRARLASPPPLGWTQWPDLSGKKVSALSIETRNECRVLKAVVDCVLMNFPSSTVCKFPPPSSVTTGQQFSGGSAYFNDYCFRVQLLHNSVTPCSAHDLGRALDINTRIITQTLDTNNDGRIDTWKTYNNGGNIPACVAKANHTPACTDRFRTADVDLPPEFVSVMETCGFTWLGRFGSPGGFEAEGGHLGCDPMHFELDRAPGEGCGKG